MQASVGKNREKAGWGKNLRAGGIKRRASTVPTLLNKRKFCYHFLIFKQITSLRASLVITPPPKRRTPEVPTNPKEICTNLQNMNIKLTLSGHRDGRTPLTNITFTLSESLPGTNITALCRQRQTT